VDSLDGKNEEADISIHFSTTEITRKLMEMMDMGPAHRTHELFGTARFGDNYLSVFVS
jgi:hypothetical protein